MTLPQGPILVVEDVTHIRELLEVTLRFKGYPVISARNGQEALEKIAVRRPALIISDILMPKLDGYALAQKLRSAPQTKDLPIVFLSATYVTPEDRAFALRLGAVHFLEKPVDTEEFLLTIGEIISKGVPSLPVPMDAPSFYQEYRTTFNERLDGMRTTSDSDRLEELLGQFRR